VAARNRVRTACVVERSACAPRLTCLLHTDSFEVRRSPSLTTDCVWLPLSQSHTLSVSWLQSSYRPVQQAPPGWLPPSPALGQPLPRPPYPMPAHAPIHLVQQPPLQRHPVVRPVRQQSVRPGASPPFASHTRPSGGPLHNVQPQGQRSAHFLPSQGAQHPSATRAGASPIVIKVPAAPLPASSTAAGLGGQ
jgi:hypothetical protein